MSLAEILSAMENEVDAEISRLEEQTAATVAQIRTAAEQDAQAIRERHRENNLQPLQRERSQRLNQARISNLRAIGQARESLFQEAIQMAQSRLSDIRQEPDYAKILQALAEEALAQINSNPVLHGDPRDKGVLSHLFPGIKVEYDLHTIGGVAAYSEDGRIVVMNTLESRLERAQAILRPAIMPLFTEEEEMRSLLRSTEL